MKKIVIPFICLCLFSSVLASEAEITAVSSVDRSTITVGDRIQYKVDIAYPQGTQIQVPGIGIQLGEFEVKDYKIEEPEKGKDGLIHATYEYVISTFTTGGYTIPPFPITYKTKEGVTSQIYTDKIDIKVESVKPSESGDIKDIRSPVLIRGGLDWWWWVLISVALLAAAIYGIQYWLKKRKMPATPPPPRPPYEVACEELQALVAENLLSLGRVREFYFRISEIIRRYLGGRFEFNAIDLTTFELLEWFSASSVSKETMEKVEKFCIDSDLVKFADYIASEKENEEIIALAREILEITKPTAPVPAIAEEKVSDLEKGKQP